MILTPHLLVGAAIGANVHNFWAVFVLAIILHFLIDAIPHWDYVTDLNDEVKNKFFFFILKALFDFCFGAFFIFYFFWSSPFIYYIALGALASILPDFLVLSYYLLRSFTKQRWLLLEKYNAFHEKFHIFEKLKTSWLGFLSEMVFIAFVIFILLK